MISLQAILKGKKCILGECGYDRDGKKGEKIIVIGIICDERGCPIWVEVFKGSTSDQTTVLQQFKTLKEKLGITRFTFVGDRGMLSRARIEELEEKTDNITSGTATSLGKQNDVASFSVEHILSALSGLSHTELKNLVDEFGIKADKRSKSSILGAISIESPDVLNRIYSRFAI